MTSNTVLAGVAGLGLTLVVACSEDSRDFGSTATDMPLTTPSGTLSAMPPAASAMDSVMPPVEVAPPMTPPAEATPPMQPPPPPPPETPAPPPAVGEGGGGGAGGNPAGGGAPMMAAGGEPQAMGGDAAQGGGAMEVMAGGSVGAAMGGGTAGVGGEGGAGGSPAAGGAPAEPGGRPAPRASSGCGKANPETGSSGNPLNDGKPYYVKLPSNYDPNMPYRLLFVFNPTGNPITWAEKSAGYEGLSAKDNAIRVYPHKDPKNLSRSDGWEGGDVSAFEPLYNAVTSHFCVDLERVFATGESSGGDFSSVLGCEHGDKLRGIGPCATKPVRGYPLNANERNCVGDVTAIVIHGLKDTEVGSENGPATRDFYKAVNECDDMSVPVDGYTDDRSNCVMFTGCKEGYPLYWCQHQDPHYGGTQHGWPRFAAKMTWEIFEAY